MKRKKNLYLDSIFVQGPTRCCFKCIYFINRNFFCWILLQMEHRLNSLGRNRKKVSNVGFRIKAFFSHTPF